MKIRESLLDWIEDITQDAEQDPHAYFNYARGVIDAFEEIGIIGETEHKEYLSRIKEAMENAE